MLLRNAHILVMDDDKDVLTAVRLLLKPEVGHIVTDTNPENLKRLLAGAPFDILLLDMNFAAGLHTGNEGLYWLRKIKEWNAHVAVVMITAYADIELAVTCLKEGASDFIVKPWHNENLLRTLGAVLEKQHTPRQKAAADDAQEAAIVGESDVMRDLFRKVEKMAPTDANVLILGENGTGKELIAQAIVRASLRSDKPFVKVDVGALTGTLFESELFGHKKGAFTDAREDRIGLIETAGGGTLFLDEIGNISLQQQAKLLTVLQNRRITPLGANRPIPVDIRIITATNVPLVELASEQRFRKDLLYRINTVEITVPPLRERGHDILLLSDYFLHRYVKKYRKSEMTLSAAARSKLLHYAYPGNVRELQYAIERAVIMANGAVLQTDDIVFSPIEYKTPNAERLQTHNLEALERTAIMQAMEQHAGNISKAARALGLTRAALYRRLEKYGI
ncbi:MAG: sigma-54 dependent transcriptional regulator [Prevotellaceae bacterium]|jgi:DNA-binding NtrC family response regulator|nr:sigma-54 dependent transcriptional regulator [Prevotellaceae bacterium]